MRGPQIVALLWLAFAGLSFSGETRYVVSVSEFANSARRPNRVFKVKNGDSLRIKLANIEQYQLKSNGAFYGWQLQKLVGNVVKYGPSQSIKTEIDELYDKGCNKDNNTNMTLFRTDIKNLSTYTSGYLGYQDVKVLKSQYGETFPHGSYLGISMANQNGCIDMDIFGTQQMKIKYEISDTTDPDACQVSSPSSCLQCAWPYQASPDEKGCGCTVNAKQYQSEKTIKNDKYQII